MPWWGWLVLGAVLLGTEMFVIDAQFYLVFFGIAAALVGLLGLVGIEMSESVQWLVFAALSIVAMIGFRRRIYQKIRKPAGEVEEPLRLGDRVVLTAPLEPGQSSRVDYRGSSWTARNIDRTTLIGEVEIVHVEGLTLHVRQLSSP